MSGTNMFTGNTKYLFFVLPSKSVASWSWRTFSRLTQELLAIDTFYWMETIIIIRTLQKHWVWTGHSLIFFQYLKKSARKSKSKGRVLKGLRVSFTNVNFLVCNCCFPIEFAARFVTGGESRALQNPVPA